MQGINVIRLNHATMRKAVEFYLDKEVLSGEVPEVTDVHMVTAQGQSFFEIVLISKEEA
jgi:hypothetical protein